MEEHGSDGTLLPNYIICTTQRSGSSYLCECIAKSGLLGTPDEWLVFLEYDKVGPQDAQLKSRSLAEIIQARMAVQRSAGHRIVGWKIMWSTFDAMKRKWAAEQEGVLDIANINAWFNNPRFVFLERENKLAQAISHAIMVKTRIAHLHNQDDERKFQEKKASLTIDRDEISYFLAKLLHEEQQWRDFFGKNQIQHIRVSYEDFCLDRGRIVRQIARSVNIDFGKTELVKLFRDIRMIKSRTRFELDLAVDYLTHMARTHPPGGSRILTNATQSADVSPAPVT